MLHALTYLYAGLTGLERSFFRAFSFLVFRPRARVISVGNLSMGGTGKTPVLIELLKEFSDHRICVLTRGYRSPYERSFYNLVGKGPHPEKMTDEAVLVNSRFPDVPQLVGKNRHHSARMAELMYNPDIMLLDDGFQYRRLHKDLNIVLWDAMSNPEEAEMIPAGRLREPLWRLKDAHVILLTRCESASAEQISFWHDWLADTALNKPVIDVKTVCEGVFSHDGCLLETDLLLSQPCLAFSAIGRPQSFYRQLESLGIEIADTIEFRDHHRFTETDMAEISETAEKKKLQIICTEKDACKISPEVAEKMQLKILKIRIQPVSGHSFSEEFSRSGISLPGR